MTIRSFTVEPAGGQPVTIFGEEDNINYFLNDDLTADEDEGVVVKQATVPSYTRRRFPGDLSPISVASGQREFLYDPGMTNGSGLPGKSFILKSYPDPGPGEEPFDAPPMEVRQFTYKGRWLDLHAFLATQVTYYTKAHNASGAKYKLTKVGP